MKTPPPPPPLLTKIPVSSDHLCRPKAPQPASDSFVRGLCYVSHAGPDSFGRYLWVFRKNYFKKTRKKLRKRLVVSNIFSNFVTYK